MRPSSPHGAGLMNGNAVRIVVALALGALALLVLVRGALRASGATDTLSIGVDIWVGFAPLQVALDRGIFAEEGLTVRLVTLKGASEMRVALSSRKVQAVTTSLDTALRKRAAGTPARVILGLDRSRGADGLVARSPIESLADLRGRHVAVQPATPSEFLLLFLLEKARVPIASVHRVEMDSADAGAAFVAGKVEAAVTWEPWLSQAAHAPGARLLASTETYPDAILDVLLAHEKFVEEQPAQVKALRRAWFRAVDLYRKDPDLFASVAARHYGVDTPTFKNMVSGLQYLDAAENARLFADQGTRGPAAEIIDAANRIFAETGVAGRAVTARELIDPAAGGQQ